MLHSTLFAALLVSISCCQAPDQADRAPSMQASPAAAPAAHESTPNSARLLAARTQTLLARAGFSPGLIDGKPGRKTKLAVEHFKAAKGADAEKLLVADSWTRPVLITNSDLDLITGPIPQDWNQRALLSFSGYSDMCELLCERGWCTPELLQILNPGVDIDAIAPGDEIIIPDVPTKPLPQLARLEINLKEQLVLGFNSANEHIFLTHCSIAAQPEKRPLGSFVVQTIVTDPDYTFDPADWPEITNVTSRLRIAPGPRTPVGSAWIGIDKPSYGLHGTVRPQDIGKTGSHGCFRLFNWDATRLAHALDVGTPIVIMESDQPAAPAQSR